MKPSDPEEVFDLPLDLRDGMQAARARAGRGYGEIDPFGIEALCQSRALETRLASVVRAFEGLLRAVDELSAAGALVGRELAHILAELSQDALAPQDFHPHRFQFFGCGRRLNSRKRAIDQILHSERALCRGEVSLLFPTEFPAEVINVEEQQNFGILGLEAFVCARLPAFRQILLRVEVLSEEAFLIRHADKIQHRRNHVHVGDENGLREIRRKLLVMVVQPLPEPRRGFAQTLGIHFRQMGARLEALIHLIGLQFSDRDPT